MKKMNYTKCNWKWSLLQKDLKNSRSRGQIALKTRHIGNAGLTRWFYRYHHFGKRIRKRHLPNNPGLHCHECGRWLGDGEKAERLWRKH